MKTKAIDFTKLQFIRIFDPIHIPKELIEQVRDKSYTIDHFYEYQSIVCLTDTKNGKIINPLNLLFVIVNEVKKVVGFFWAVVAPLSKELIINTFSMKKEYWGKGEAVALLEKKCKEILKESGLSKIYWITNYPKHSERYGFKRSKGVLMEYNLGESNNGQHSNGKRCETGGESESLEQSATRISELDSLTDTVT